MPILSQGYRRGERLLQRPPPLPRLRSRFLCKFCPIQKRNHFSHRASGTNDLHLMSHRTTHYMEKALSATGLLWTVRGGPDLSNWTLVLDSPRIFIWTTLLWQCQHRFGGFKHHALHNAGRMDRVCSVFSAGKETDCQQCSKPFCLLLQLGLA